jgi:hypothetical protein
MSTAKPGRVIPATVERGQTRGWSFTVMIHGVEFQPVGYNAVSAAKAKTTMRKVVKEINS